MSNACTPILVGGAPPVSELWFLFVCLQKWPKKINYINYVIAINASLQCLACTHAYTSSVELEPCTILCYLLFFFINL